LILLGDPHERPTVAANRLPVILRGERQPASRLIRFGWVDRKAPLGRVDCPYAAEPETSNLQRLFIYGVSPGMASRNFRAHRKGGDHLRGILLRKPKRSCSLPEFGEGEETARPGSPKPHSGEEMAAAFKIA
jgi:hypothetical protein